MILALTIIFLVFGLIIGSFLNVVIIRYNTERSFDGRSGCMHCKHQLSWRELIPIISFLVQGGRCVHCKTKISIQYPIVEFLTGIIFAALFLKFQNIFFGNTLIFALTYAYYAAMFSILLVIAVYDLKHKIIPDKLSLALGVATFFGLFFYGANGFNLHFPSLLDFISGLIVSLPFALFWFFSHGTWMGLGDAKLAIGLGWLLGLSRMLSGVVLAFWSGAIIGIILIFFSKKHGMRSEIPFAPFLVLGAMLAYLLELHIFPI